MVIANGVNVNKYEYVVYGDKSTGDRELDDVVMMVQNEISNTKLTVISPTEAIRLIANGKYVLSPIISVKSEKWDGGQTYITINFYDIETNQSVAIIKSSGIGFSRPKYCSQIYIAKIARGILISLLCSPTPTYPSASSS